MAPKMREVLVYMQGMVEHTLVKSPVVGLDEVRDIALGWIDG